MDQGGRSSKADVELFLLACPGPSVARHGLRVAALQEVKGIPGLSPSADDAESRAMDLQLERIGRQARGDKYFFTVIAVAGKIGCRPAYLSEAARRRGYQYSRALRWVRFLHGMALRAHGVSALTASSRLAFSDLAGWSRFTKRLVGRTASQLPNLPLDYWVRKAVHDVFLSSTAPNNQRGDGNH